MFVVVAMCFQLQGMTKPNCFPYKTTGIEFSAQAACEEAAFSHRVISEASWRKKFEAAGKKIERLLPYAECKTAYETVKLLESNSRK